MTFSGRSAIFCAVSDPQTDEEANDVLFKIVHEMCVAGFTFNDMEDIKIGSSEMFTPANFRSIGQAKYYLRKMGYNEPEERFDEIMKDVVKCIRKVEPDCSVIL